MLRKYRNRHNSDLSAGTNALRVLALKLEARQRPAYVKPDTIETERKQLQKNPAKSSSDDHGKTCKLVCVCQWWRTPSINFDSGVEESVFHDAYGSKTRRRVAPTEQQSGCGHQARTLAVELRSLLYRATRV
jgi:hypothetical protein